MILNDLSSPYSELLEPASLKLDRESPNWVANHQALTSRTSIFAVVLPWLDELLTNTVEFEGTVFGAAIDE